MDASVDAFDRRFTLRALLGPSQQLRLSAALEALLGPRFAMEDDMGEVLLCGQALDAQACTVPIEHEFEVMGHLRAACALPQVQAAVVFIQILMETAARERMTSELHLQTTQDNYHELLKKHSELEQSEARYRELSAQLEDRVTEQVGVIEKSQRQLFQSERMASVGHLAAGMAHEINNPIGFIQSNLVTAQDYVGNLARLGEVVKAADCASVSRAWQDADMDFVVEDFNALLDESLSGARRIARIVADLKSFSSVNAMGEVTDDINESLRVVVRLAQTQIGQHAVVDLDLAPCPPIQCDKGKLGQVFLSLIQNADHAVAEGGRITVRSSVDNGWIRVDVADNGCGISPESLAHVFDPFYTTKTVGHGTGLGLTVTRDIVMAHGGRIELASELEKGTTVTVWLPPSPK